MYKNAKLLNHIDLSAPHKIEVASYNYYPIEEPHPDRILNSHDLFIVLEGAWEVYQNEEVYLLEKGDALFLFAGQHHYGLKDCEKNTKTIFIHFTPSENDYYGTSDGRSGEFAVFPTKINCKNNYLVNEYFKKINNIFWSHESHKDVLLQVYTNLLLCELESVKSKSLQDNIQLINEIINMLNSNLHRFYSTDELAEKYYISKRKLIYLFKTYTGTTPHAYQINMKLDLSAVVLRNERNIRLKDIAERYGFYDEFHFSKLFKAKFGYSPKHIRTAKSRQS